MNQVDATEPPPLPPEDPWEIVITKRKIGYKFYLDQGAMRVGNNVFGVVLAFRALTRQGAETRGRRIIAKMNNKPKVERVVVDTMTAEQQLAQGPPLPPPPRQMEDWHRTH